MKKTFTKLTFLLAALLIGTAAQAQINQGSAIPVDFRVNSPSSIDGLYDYATQTDDWGPILDHTVTGDVVWTYDGTDSLCCAGPVVTDLTGKIALIRRGVCTFSLKTWNAQEAGAIGAIICNHYNTATEDGDFVIGGMAAGDSAALVTIPSIFVSRNTCEQLQSVLDNGGTVNASFEVKSFSNPVHAYTYSTPEGQIVPLQDMGVTFINLSTDVLPSLTLNLEITDPNGEVTTISETAADIAGQTVNAFTMDAEYLPEAQGEYTVHYSNSENSETFTEKFVVSDLTYAQDNDEIVDWIAQTSAGFVEDLFRYDFGNFYRAGTEAGTATYVSFMLANPDSLYTGDPEADVFNIRIYDADPDGDGTVPPDADSYDALDPNGGGAVIVGFADYVLTGNEAPYELLNVELEEPVELQPGKIYLVMVQYDGTAAGIGTPPWYAFGGTGDVAGGLGSAVFTDRFYTGGWTGGYKGVIRLHMNGYLSGDNFVALDKSKISVSPNPASTEVNLNLDLEQMASEVTVQILDFTGKLISTTQLENVQQGSYPFNVGNLANGTYFLSVQTPEGFRAKAFQVLH